MSRPVLIKIDGVPDRVMELAEVESVIEFLTKDVEKWKHLGFAMPNAEFLRDKLQKVVDEAKRGDS